MSEGKYFYVSERVIYEGYYPQEGQHLRILRLRRELGTMIDVDRPIDPLPTSCDAFAYTDKGVHLFWVAPKTPESTTEEVLSDPKHVKLTNGQDYPLICQSKHRVICSYTEENGITWPVSVPRQCSAVTQEGFELAAEYNRHASAFVEHDMQLFIKAVKRTARSAYSKTLATSSDEALDIFVWLWFGFERLSYESDEQLRERCEAKMRREFT